MGLTDYEKSVLTELLSGVSEGDLILIAKTVSQKLLNISTVNRALEVILLHSQTVESVLHRKKISKQLLFNYLHYKQIPVQPHLSKDEIIQRLLHYWKENSLTWERTGQACESNHQTHVMENSSNHHQTYSNSGPIPDYTYSTYSGNYQSSLVPQSQETIPQAVNNVPQSQNLVPQSQEITSLSQDICPQSQDICPQSQDICPQSQDICPQSSFSGHENQLVSNINVQELGIEFAKWFNDRFNSCSSAHGYPFDSTMFFTNATAEFKIVRSVNGQETVENTSAVEHNELIGAAIVQLQRVYNLFLNTNLESLKVTRNSYGNILIGVCGSLHSCSQLVGVFEELFQLFHDPLCTLSEKPVWKIQKALLHFKFVNSYREVEGSSPTDRHDMLEIDYEGSKS